jgi:hypothetical protein
MWAGIAGRQSRRGAGGHRVLDQRQSTATHCRDTTAIASAGHGMDARLLELGRRQVRLGTGTIRGGPIPWCGLGWRKVGASRAALGMGGWSLASQVKLATIRHRCSNGCYRPARLCLVKGTG